MDLLILNTNFDAVYVLDTYESFIWTDRYYEAGDFELYVGMRSDIFKYIRLGYYIQKPNSEHTMIIEKIQVTTDTEEGVKLIVTGRSLESILDRRILWGGTTLSGNFQSEIQRILNGNIISPKKKERTIPNFIFSKSTDKKITNRSVRKTKYVCDNIYDLIVDRCKAYNIGFKVTLNDKKQLVFKLYKGVDRSYDQSERPYVIFSPKFENMINSNYIESDVTLKNVSLVLGEMDYTDSTTKQTKKKNVWKTVGSVKKSGFARREMFSDARDIDYPSKEEIEKNADLVSQFHNDLKERGKDDLSQNKKTVSFEGQAETSIMFRYDEDFFIGDVVQVADDYGHETAIQIMEIVTSDGSDGCITYPTFALVSDIEDESEDEGDIIDDWG